LAITRVRAILQRPAIAAGLAIDIDRKCDEMRD
jgi:hypothetical protein